MRQGIALSLTAAVVLAAGPEAALAEAPIEAMKGHTINVLTRIKIQVIKGKDRGKGGYVESTGSGFVVGEDRRHVVTNNHVCRTTISDDLKELSRKLTVRATSDPEDTTPAKVAWYSESKDLCVIEVDQPLEKEPVELVHAEGVRDGQRVIAMGFPGEYQVTDAKSALVVKITEGILSAKVTGDPQTIDAKLYQTDAPLNPGNSGGPLFDECGRVIGVNVMRDARKQSMGWAVRVDELAPALKQLGLDVEFPSEACSAATGGASPVMVAMQVGTMLAALAAAGFAFTRRGRQYVSRQYTRYSRGGKAVVPPPARSGKPVLRGVAGYYAGATMECSGEAWVLGRDPRVANLVFPSDNTGVSKRHCQVRYDPARGRFLLQDTWSANGTFRQDGQQVEAGQEQELAPGSRFYLSDRGTMFEVAMESG